MSRSLLLYCLFAFGVLTLLVSEGFSAYRIELKNGFSFVVDSYRRIDGRIQFFKSGGLIEIDAGDVLRIREIKVSQEERGLPGVTPATGEANSIQDVTSPLTDQIRPRLEEIQKEKEVLKREIESVNEEIERLNRDIRKEGRVLAIRKKRELERRREELTKRVSDINKRIEDLQKEEDDLMRQIGRY